MLHTAIAAGLILGLIVGLGAAATGNEWLHMIANGSAPFGAIFMNAIRMVVIPLIVTVIFTSIARLGDPRKLGRIGGMTIAFYWISLIPAIAIGMLTMKFGLRFASDIEMPEAAATDVPELQSIVDFIVSLVPANPFAAASSGAILPLIVFTALVAAATGTLPAERRERLINLAEDGSEALIKLVWWILYIAPIGVFGLAAPVTAKLGWDLVQSLGIFIVFVFVGLLIFLVLVTLPLMYFVGGHSPARYLGGIFGGVSVAVSTTSTAAAIPVTLEETTNNLKVSPTIADLLVPLGASMHRPGSALFQGAAIVFLAHLYGVPIPVAAVGAAMLATFLVSLTVAPVPSSSVVTMAPALDAVGVPVAGLAIVLGIDRIPDMMRSGVNLLAQVSAAVLVDRWTDEEDAGAYDKTQVLPR
ncbi:MAG: dicarboxylate/amino acid:cation symporter [Gammaproteobacteria bacterium]|nr:dicarboxylate/amino acid:cation symporter [Gammaproteobacteria bacterium]